MSYASFWIRPGEIPNNWTVAIELLIKLLKKGDLRLCKNWPGIMLLSMVGKILSRVFLAGWKMLWMQCLRKSKQAFERDEVAQTKLPYYASLWSSRLNGNHQYISVFWTLQKPLTVSTEMSFGSYSITMEYQRRSQNLIRKFYEGFKAQMVHSRHLSPLRCWLG